MATSALSLLIVFLLAATVSARPCKTLFYFSATTTTTYYPYNSLNRDPNPDSLLRSQNPRYLTIIFTTTTSRFLSHRSSLNFKPDMSSDKDSQSSEFPLKFYSSTPSSIRDRTRDIMSVVGALLFGIGCGALTAVGMFFVWALFSPRRFDYEDMSSDDSEKWGYEAIPTKPKLVDDDDKKPAPAAKEVV